ncbi:pyridoxal phosphate-dependent aminotransferase [Nitratidesulfovibrio sp. SRB-5]|uniref:pyridoxal phosphate-dependent aminotransferase n=1 Tax=Nitratidesulfovibrio sp. SRB-5 TaxID=2872636 RepID=UPI0010283587|nr:pyridoxal phosphate-dependent aminotransferase [Nitratidesulfovibrio sp. SRB-5]MBZ2173176.1 pyridoxal phosphate-dependent aminotransferase [Nitratidesulfovibrio sp. SRB-5]RXF76271.1 pyridoxal phosphate-dependent aminotransferase [Desulfovibrio sp. DS-1]
MRISDRLTRIKPSATLAVNAKALELKAKGVQVVSLAVGEPDFPTPEHVREAAKTAIDQGFTRYTQVPGIPELRQAVCGYFARFYGVEAPMEATVVTNGGKQALYNLFQCLLNPGDEVLVPAPYWVSYPALVELAAGVPVFVASPAERGFKVTPEELDRAVTPKTRVLLLNSPSNPTGACYSRAETDAIMEWAIARDLFVVSDEIYDRLVYEPAEAVSVCDWWERHPENVAVVNGLAKTFAMTGWRVGYALAHPDLIKAMTKIQGQSTSNICSVAQKAALAALTGPYDAVEEMKKSFRRRRDLAHGIVSSWPGVVCPKPDGAFYLFADMRALFTPALPDSASLCTHIMEQANVALVPGVAFGDDACLRFSYAVSDDTLMIALDKVAKVLFG